MFKNKPINKDYNPVYGKTYSLFGVSQNTEEYFQNIKSLVNHLSEKFQDKKNLLDEIRLSSTGFRKFNSFLANHQDSIEMLNNLSSYTINTKGHLENISVFKRFDKTIGAKEFQYHAFMLEIEIMNQMNIDKFKATSYKIGLLPHCLHDLTKNCESKINGIDYQCKSCSQKCYINYSCDILKSHDINPYLWKTLNLKSTLKKLMKEHDSIGVFGMACIPELMHGMRKCDKYGIPVIGLPLDANLCMRWMGDFHDNSINLKALEDLLA